MVNFLKRFVLASALASMFLAAAWGAIAALTAPAEASFAPSVIRSKSSGVVTLTAGTGSSGTGTLGTTLTSTSKAHLSMNGCTIDTVVADEEIYHARMVITNTTTVTATRGCSGTCPDATTVCAYDVIEFY